MKTLKDKYAKEVRRIADDPIGLEAIGELLGLELKKHEQLQNDPVVAILMPSYSDPKQRTMDSIREVMNYTQKFCSSYRDPIRGSSVVHWVRNDMYTELLKRDAPHTHVLYADSDMIYERDYLVRMLRHDADIVCAAYTVRSDPPIPNVHLVNKKTGEARRVLSWMQRGVRVDGVLASAEDSDETITGGTGLMLIKHHVFPALTEMYASCAYEKSLWGLTDDQIAPVEAIRRRCIEKSRNGYWFQFLPRLAGYAETGEDTSFCLKAALCGFKVVVDTSIKPKHIGEYAYSYDDFEAFQPQEISKAITAGEYEARQ